MISSRKVFWRKYLLCSMFLSSIWVYFGEIGVYSLYPFLYWSKEHTNLIDEDLKILFISDIHLMCTVPLVENALFRWDADRYIRMNVRQALAYLVPDAVVSLGDTFDQGFYANDGEWAAYQTCLKSVIPSHIQLFVTPGDNDIGGEGRDVMNKDVIDKFKRTFSSLNDVHIIRNVALVQVNTVPLIRHSPIGEVEGMVRKEMEMFAISLAEKLRGIPPINTTLMFSHVPLQEMQDDRLKNILFESVKPNFYFSGHTHSFRHTIHRIGGMHVQQFLLPTASYRMGEAHMAAGAVTISKDGHLSFHLLWFPPRFPILVSYLVILAIISFLCVQYCRSRRRCLGR